VLDNLDPSYASSEVQVIFPDVYNIGSLQDSKRNSLEPDVDEKHLKMHCVSFSFLILEVL
jgi:hypothetical protein